MNQKITRQELDILISKYVNLGLSIDEAYDKVMDNLANSK